MNKAFCTMSDKELKIIIAKVIENFLYLAGVKPTHQLEQAEKLMVIVFDEIKERNKRERV